MTRLIDLSQPIANGGIVFPNLAPIKITAWPTAGAANVSHISFCDHTSTHIDATVHFDPNGETIEKLPLERCCGDALVLDLSHKKPGESISVVDLEEAAKRVGEEIRHGDILLLYTSASRLWDTPEYLTYRVGIAVETLRWLITIRDVRVVGVDEVTIDVDTSFPAHHLVKELEYYHIENMANLDKIPRPRFKFYGFPLKIVGASAGLMRAVAVVED